MKFPCLYFYKYTIIVTFDNYLTKLTKTIKILIYLVQILN